MKVSWHKLYWVLLQGSSYLWHERSRRKKSSTYRKNLIRRWLLELH